VAYNWSRSGDILIPANAIEFRIGVTCESYGQGGSGEGLKSMQAQTCRLL